ncbi:hypothetical protein POX_c03524 [Penicillium oxalicum]|uniref:hypothetical protein n=1 Tax=Penicillium oxalicum TaxID=69781 RepID=UPI0020B8740E|nr:hypothetical protein POX_c03524 [Penicillium oxalicum]KAI2790678.1 hypothetical protein POX_c03524 [Penicillium oxalicum]
MDLDSATNHPAVTESSLRRASSSARAPLAGGRQITRNRASYSCHTCRRRKVKCDKVHPICGNCAKTGTECTYDASASRKADRRRDEFARETHGLKRRRGQSHPLTDEVDEGQSTCDNPTEAMSPGNYRDNPHAIEARLDKLMSMIERIGGNPRALAEAEKKVLAEKGTVNPAVAQHLQQDSSALKGPPLSSRRSSPHRQTADSSGDEFPIPSGPPTDLVDPIGSLNLGHLSLDDGGRSRYVGTTYWAYISNEINDLNQLLRGQPRSHETSSENEHMESSDYTGSARGKRIESVESPLRSPVSHGHGGSFQQSILFSSGDSPSTTERSVEPEMLDHVPTHRQSHILYKGFMSGVHAISPVVHPPTVLKQYRAFWEWYDYTSYSGSLCPNPSFIPLLYAIWYGGSVTISIRTIKAEFNTPSRFALSSRYSEEVTRWLTKISFPRSPSLHGLAAYLIVQTILSKEEEPLKSSLFVSLAMRVAQTMGLHRDPANFGIETSEAEYRRRLWWHIMHMDGVVAMSSGLPPLVGDESYWDVRETSEVKDTLLGTPVAEEYEGRVASKQREPDNPDDPSVCGGSSMVNVFYLTARGKYTMARAVRRILRIQLGTKPVTRRDMEELRTILLDLQNKLNSIVDRIPECPANKTSPQVSERTPSISDSPEEAGRGSTLPGESRGGCAEQYHTRVLVSYHRWAKIMLSLLFALLISPFSKMRTAEYGRQPAKVRFVIVTALWKSSFNWQPILTFNHFSGVGREYSNHQPMHATMIMLIDLYERPYSPEATRSRAFIDRILALSGPDGGVVGGEDGITIQRPLKDGGREAWDMIRRLRQKAWQKAGLDPQILWTEQDQAYASVKIPARESLGTSQHLPDSGKTSPPGSPGSLSVGSPRPPVIPGRQPAEFTRMFYDMTRSQIQPGPTKLVPFSVPGSSARTSYELPAAAQTSAPSFTPQKDPPSTAAMALEPGTLPPSSAVSAVPQRASGSSSVSAVAPALSEEDAGQYLSSSAFACTMPFIDSKPLYPAQMSAPTPPSMVDPNLNFDWDQWDAVFGQHLPVADELMELDPVSGLDLANPTLTSGTSVANPPFGGSSNAASAGNGSNSAASWINPGPRNPQMPSGDWAGF